MAATTEARLVISARDKASAQLTRIRKSLMGIKASAGAVTSALTGLGGIASVGGLSYMAKTAIDAGSAITDMATATGTGIEQLQVLTAAADDAGASHEQMSNLLVRANKSANDAARGLSTAKDAFAQLNIDAETFIDLPTERKLEILGQAIVNAEGDVRAYGSALDLLGTRNAPKLMEVLQRLGTEGFDVMAQQAREAGLVMESETAKRLDAAADEIERFKRRGTILFGEAIANLMDQSGTGRKILVFQFAKIASQFGGQLIDAIVDASQIGGTVMASAFKFIAGDFAAEIMLSISHAMQNIPGAAMALAPIFQKAAQAAVDTRGDFESMGDAISAAVANTEPLTNFGEEFGNYWQTQIDALKVEFEDLKKVAGGASDEAENSGKSVSAWMGDAAQAVSGLASGLENGLINAAKNGKAAFGDMAEFIIAEIQRILIRSMVLRPLFGFIGGLFPAGNAIGQAFSGAFSTRGAFGGNFQGGQSVLVGEHGPELLRMPSGGVRITPNREINTSGPTFNVDMRGADVAAVSRLERLVAQVNGTLEQRAVAAVGQTYSRNPQYLR